MPAPSPRRSPAPSAAARAVKAAFKKAPAAAASHGAVPVALRDRRRKTAETRLRDALEARTNGHVPEDLGERLGRLVAAWAARGFEDGFGEAERFEKDCYEAAELAEAEATGDEARRFEVLEGKYRELVVAEHGKIELRGLQMSERVYQTLDVAYVELRIQDDSSEGEVVKAGEGMEIRIIPRLSVEELVVRHARAVVVGAPGSGKSTLMAYLAAGAATGKVGEKERLVPFVVPVRSLGGAVLDAEVIARTVRDVDAAFVRQVLGERRGLVLVDGLDEAQVGPEKLIPALAAFAEAHPGNRVVVTSRPAGGMGSERVEIPGFVTTTLLPMEREDVYTFIRRWCEAAELSIQADAGRARGDAKRASEDLIARVRTSRPVEKLAQTPLLCSVVCVVHRFLGHKIPERRAALYEVCTNVLLYEWDRAKFPDGAAIGKLDAQQKRHLLSGLAYWMHDERVAEAPEGEVLRIFAERLLEVGGEAGDAKSIVRQIQERSGLLIERRPGFYAFSHLTFQEYLTAVEIARDKKTGLLVRHHEDSWWREVTVLTVGLPGVDAASVVRGLLEHTTSAISAATFLAAECAEAAVHLPPELRQAIEARIASVVPPRNLEDMHNLIQLGDPAAPILLRAISKSSPEEKAMLALTLGQMAYEPAATTLALMLNSEETIISPPRIPLGGIYIGGYWSGTLGSLAAIALFNLALTRVGTRSFVEDAVSAAPAMASEWLRGVSDGLLYNDSLRARMGKDASSYLPQFLRHTRPLLKAPPPGTSPPKPSSRSG